MLFQEDDDTLSFISLLKSIQTETNVLKCVSSLRSLPPNDKLTTKIFEIENAVQNIEKNLEDFNEFLSSEMKTCEIMDNEIIIIAEKQSRKINELHMSFPQSLVDAITNSKESSIDKKDHILSEINNTIKQDELLLIPKSTRGRLTVGVVNGALSDIKLLTKEKTKVNSFYIYAFISLLSNTLHKSIYICTYMYDDIKCVDMIIYTHVYIYMYIYIYIYTYINLFTYVPTCTTILNV
jgi:hypothetical protein